MIRLVKNQGEIDLSRKMLKGDPGEMGPPGPQGPQGEPGLNTVWVGKEAPTEEYYNVWINPEGQATPLATEEYVQEQIDSITIVDEVSY